MAKGCVFRKVGAVYPLLQCKALPNGSALPNIPTKYPEGTKGAASPPKVPAEGPRRRSPQGAGGRGQGAGGRGQGRVGSAPSPLGEGWVGSPYYRAFLAKWYVPSAAEMLSDGCGVRPRYLHSNKSLPLGGIDRCQFLFPEGFLIMVACAGRKSS